MLTTLRTMHSQKNDNRRGYFCTQATRAIVRVRAARAKLPAVESCALVVAVLWAAQFSPLACAQTPQFPVKRPAVTWRFAVSGDSRNCGDVVMPAIAASVAKQRASFYWHLGDFRWLAHVDEDLRHGPEHLSDENDRARYQSMAWDDFVKSQVADFGQTPVFLGIGNHETTLEKNREGFIDKFKSWLDAPPIRAQRVKDDPADTDPHTYYHWMIDGVDFINLDNASQDEFSSGQVGWFEKVIARDASDPNIQTLVVGMHAALPDSLSFGHSMSNWPQGVESGRRVYQDLWNAHAHKHVYVLASHSHFYMDGAFHTDYWQEKMLPGWIVGTAGATRYPLPQNWRDANQAMTNVYGYLLATVNPSGRRDGTIRFQFHQIHPRDIPRETAKRFDAGFVNWCFEQNTLCGDSQPHCDSAGSAH